MGGSSGPDLTGWAALIGAVGSAVLAACTGIANLIAALRPSKRRSRRARDE